MQLPKQPQTTEARILAHVEQTPGGCWLWLGTAVQGVPRMSVGSRDGVLRLRRGARTTMRVASAVLRLWNGRRLRRRQPYVATCGNPRCVSPEHLRRA